MLVLNYFNRIRVKLYKHWLGDQKGDWESVNAAEWEIRENRCLWKGNKQQDGRRRINSNEIKVQRNIATQGNIYPKVV